MCLHLPSCAQNIYITARDYAKILNSIRFAEMHRCIPFLLWVDLAQL